MCETLLLRHRAPAVAALVLFLLLLLPGAASAQEPQGTPTVNDIARDLYCPLCAGLTVDVCELEVCRDMKQVIAERLEAGESPEQIRTYFVEQYGQKVLGRPSTEGFHLTAWVIPFLALLLAGVVLVGWLRRPSAVPPAPAASVPSTASVDPSEPEDEYHARLERELQRLDE